MWKTTRACSFVLRIAGAQLKCPEAGLLSPAAVAQLNAVL